MSASESEPKEPLSNDGNALIRRVGAWVFLVGAVTLTGTMLTMLVIKTGIWSERPELSKILMDHFVCVVGLPMSAIASLFIVLVCEIFARDKIRFKALGVQFEGASGQVILWALCFITMTAALNILWDKRSNSGLPVNQQSEAKR
jgi:hypothetical protein